MFWRRSARISSEYSNLMKDKQINLKEKLKQALTSTIRVISDDFEIKKKNEDNKSEIDHALDLFVFLLNWVQKGIPMMAKRK